MSKYLTLGLGLLLALATAWAGDGEPTVRAKQTATSPSATQGRQDYVGRSNTAPSTFPGTAASRPATAQIALDNKSVRIVLCNDDKAAPGLYAVGRYDRLSQWPLPAIYDGAVSGNNDGHDELIGRMDGFYSPTDEIDVIEYVRNGNELFINICYVRGQPPKTPDGPKRALKRAYLLAPIPQDLAPGRYRAIVQLVEYLRENGRLVVAPKTEIRASEHLRCTFDVPVLTRATSMTATLPAAPSAEHWVKAVNGLRAQIEANGVITKRLGMEVAVQFENASNQAFAIDCGELPAMSWRVVDAAGKEVDPVDVPRVQPAADWLTISPGRRICKILGSGELNRDGRLKIGFSEWKLPPGRYSIRCTLALQSVAPGKPASVPAWAGKIDLPTVEFDVICEVGDKELLAAAKTVRTATPAGGLPMWQALAELIRPGMTVRQMKLVLPPREMILNGEVQQYPTSTCWSGFLFWLRYPLDDQFELRASGMRAIRDQSTTQPEWPDDDDMILSGKPEIKASSPITTRPAAVQPASSPATQPTTAVWSKADNGLECRLFIAPLLAIKNGPHKTVIFEVRNVSDKKMLLPTWAYNKHFLGVDVLVAGRPDVKSPPIRDVNGGYVELEAGKSFSMNLTDDYDLAAGRLDGVWLRPFDPAGKEYEISVAFLNDVPTISIVDKEVPCWTGRVQSQALRVVLPPHTPATAPATRPAPTTGPAISAWGKTVNGVAMRVEAPQSLYKVGDWVVVDLVFKNISGKATKIYIQDTPQGPVNCGCTITNLQGKPIGGYWSPAKAPQDRLLDLEPKKELHISIPLDREKVLAAR